MSPGLFRSFPPGAAPGRGHLREGELRRQDVEALLDLDPLRRVLVVRRELRRVRGVHDLTLRRPVVFLIRFYAGKDVFRAF